MRKHSFIKIISFLIALIMALCVVPTFSAEVNKAETAEAEESIVTYATIDEFLCEIENGEITVTGYIGSASNILIRDTLGGYPVTAIADGAFKNNKTVQVVYIYPSVKNIGESAFENCTDLWYVQIQGSATIVGKNAFKNTTFFEGDRFWSDGLLMSFGADIILGAKKDLKGVVRIPYSVTSIASSAFANCKNIEGIYFYDQFLRTIGNDAFENCENLKGVKIPASVTFIGSNAFAGCEKAEVYSVKETDFIKSYCEYEKLALNIIGRYAIYNKDKDITLYADDELAFDVEEVFSEEEMKDIEKSIEGINVKRTYKVRVYDPMTGQEIPYYDDLELKVPLNSETVVEIYKKQNADIEHPYKAYHWIFNELKDGYAQFDYYNNAVIADVDFNYFSTTDETTNTVAYVPATYEFKSLYYYFRNETNDSKFYNDIDKYIPEGKSFLYAYAKVNGTDTFPNIPSNIGVKIKAPTEYKENVAYLYNYINNIFTPTDCVTKDGFVEFLIPQNLLGYYGCIIAGIEEEDPTETTVATEPAESLPAFPATQDSIPTDPAEDTKPSTNDSVPTEPEATDPVESTNPTEDTTSAEVETTVPDNSQTPTESTPDEDDLLLGDVNRDGKINIRDATLIQKHLAKLASLDEKQMIIADINLDNKVNIKDATTIQKKIANLI